jgi:streptomycin 6-kinase
LPVEFVRRNQEDVRWLSALRQQLDYFIDRWALRLEPPFPNVALNYVAPATRANGERCVFKLSRHVTETRCEIAALHLWHGRGAARLLEADPDRGALLIEYVEPGTMLAALAESDDDAATLIAADMLRRLWLPAPVQSELRPLASWCAAFDRNREAILSGTTGFPVTLFERADNLRRELLLTTNSPTVLHGDLHHFNVLRAQRADWLSIDPKGLVGDACFDLCQFLRNPRRVEARVNARRLDILCSELGLDRARTKDWCLVHAVLDACWDFEDGNSWHAAVAYAEETRTF